jgi:hypothetical protein
MDHGGDYLDGRPRRHKRAIALGTIALFMLLTTIIGATAISITAPSSVHEGQPLSVAVSGAGTVTIARDGTIIATGAGGASHSFQTDSTSAGVYTYAFSDSSGGESRLIEVIDVPLAVRITAPLKQDISTSSVTFSLQTNLAPEFCYITIDGTSHTLTATSGTAFSGTFPVPDGVRSVDYKCKLGSEIAANHTTLHVDTTPPVVTAHSPSGEVTGPFITLAVDTDEIALCRYGDSDVEYSALPYSMSSSYALRNTATIESATHGSATYFVRCTDVSGNKMESPVIISFLNRLPPTAEIDIDTEPPLKAGTYKVKLTTNVLLSATPVLKYRLPETGREEQVVLSGEGNGWTGYIVIPVNAPDATVSFTFSGTSQQGVVGTQITEGSLFMVDALPPDPVDVLTVKDGPSYISLQWFSTVSKDHEHYNIYRADHEGVTYTDFYTTARGVEYTDRSAQGARYHYYRIAPVDAAGNIGPLSIEAYGSAIDAVIKETPAADPLAIARIDEELAALGGLMLDANASIRSLESEPNNVNIEIISHMRLVEKGRKAVLLLETAAADLKELRERSPTQAEADAAIARARSTAEKARAMLVRKIVPQHQAETTQSADYAGLERLLPYPLMGVDMTAKEKASYLRSSMSLQDRITVKTIAYSFTIYDLANKGLEHTLVVKRITLQDPANDVKLIESIPKTFAEDVSLITFFKQPIVLEADPVVQYTFPVIQEEEYSYFVQRIVPLDEVKRSRTFLYPKIPERASGDLLSGQVTKDTAGSSFFSGDWILILLGIVTIIGLGAYYVSLEEKPFKGLPSPAVPAASIVSRPMSNPPARIVRPVTAPFENVATPAPDAKVLLRAADGFIDDKRYDEALMEYRDALRLLKANPALEQELGAAAGDVYSKLMLFKRLTDAKTALERKDAISLGAALADVRGIAQHIGDQDTTLMREAKASYAEFARSLNTLEIERVGNY